MDTQKKHIFMIENPLLDISIDMADNSLLEKYQLAHGQASLATEAQLPMYDEIWGMEGRLAIPGGSTLNSARSANFILKNQGHANSVVYYGSIADDEKGHTLEQVLKDEGVTGNFHKDTETPTGTCAVIVVNKERTLCANLAAACKYKIEHLHNNMDALRNAALIYSSSFFITSNVQALHEVGQFASDNDIPMGFNFSAVFLIQFELQNVLKALEHADYVFANEDEAAAFGTSQGMEGAPLTEVAKLMAKWKKSNTKRPRVAIVTHGAKPVIVCQQIHGTEEVTLDEYPIEPLEKHQIVDTNGAGDSFVGAFMSQLYQGKDLATCVKAGIYLSREVVQRSGCMFPDKMEWSA